MIEQESKNATSEQIKEKIRERYKGVSEDILDVIPATPKDDFYRSDVKKRVAVYARVSTDDPNQTSSYELQKNHYEELVNKRDNWILVNIYADEGISGTSLKNRDSFNLMIQHCYEGKIDLIVTKSVSRFARNILDCIGTVRQLKAANPPIGVYFETENLFTLDEHSEMALSFIATMAQEESHTKSEVANGSIEMRFKRGIFLTPVLLGYDHDDDGNLIINEDEAKTVRLIFFSYLYGYSAQQIADALTQLERYTKKGNQYWSSSSILQILSNERYCGDVLARKTFTPNYLDHKSKKNKHDRNQYRQKDHHDPIITREDFFAVQKLIRNAKYGNKGYFPEMHVIPNGALEGYVSIHPRWAGFTIEDYYEACCSTNTEVNEIAADITKLRIKQGCFDLSGYEVVRTQFLSLHGQLLLTFTHTTLFFNSTCIKKFFGAGKIELFVHPIKRALAVRKSKGNSKYAISWCRQRDEHYIPIKICGSAFVPVLYKLFGWISDYKYSVLGRAFTKNGETLLIFKMRDAMRIDEEEISYPSRWAENFGEDFYKTQATMEEFDESEDWGLDKDSLIIGAEENVTSQEEAAKHITSILGEIGAKNV